MDNHFSLEEFGLMLFKEVSANVIQGLEAVVDSAVTGGLYKTEEYKDFVERLTEVCNRANEQIKNSRLD